MKKFSVILAAACVAFASCDKVNPIEVSPANETVFSASATNCVKTVLVENVKTYWTPGDDISVFDIEATNNKFTTEITENAATADFKGTVTQSEEYYALYPYNASATLSGSAISTVLPSAQTAVSGNYDSAAALLVAKTETKALTFSPVASFLKITLIQEVDAISVAANNGENLAGNCTVTLGESLAVTGGTSSMVELSGETALAAGTYYVAVLPATYTKGLTVTLTSADGAKILKNSSASMTLAAGTIYDMGTISGDWSSAITSVPATLFLNGNATEGNGQQMRKEGDKFVIYNTIKAGKINFTDGDGNNYYPVGATLVKGTGAAVVDARENVTRITVDFAAKTVSYEKIHDKVWVQNAWNGTVTCELSYQEKGKWSGYSSTLPIADNGDERFSFRTMVNGVNVRWGSNRGNYGDFTNGTAEFYRLYETEWDQWNNLYKIFKGFKGVELTYDIDANDLNFMRFRISVRGNHEMTLEGDGLEVYSRPFRKEADDKYVIYTKVYGSDVKYLYNGTEVALTVPADKKTAVTRITVNPSNGNVAYDSVDDWAHCKFCADFSDIGHQQYRGNGIWDGNSGGIWWRSMGGWMDERYKFSISINGVQTCWGRHADAVHWDLHYNNDESFWWMDEYEWEGHQWDYAWKLAGDIKDGATAFITINTNGDGAHMTHMITKN